MGVVGGYAHTRHASLVTHIVFQFALLFRGEGRVQMNQKIGDTATHDDLLIDDRYCLYRPLAPRRLK
jgi:hypothetical protein